MAGMTHAEIADHCLEPVQKGHSAKLIAEAKERICTALADQRRDEMREQANKIATFDGTPSRPKEPTT